MEELGIEVEIFEIKMTKAVPIKTKFILKKIVFFGTNFSAKRNQLVAQKVKVFKNVKNPDNKKDEMLI